MIPLIICTLVALTMAPTLTEFERQHAIAPVSGEPVFRSGDAITGDDVALKITAEGAIEDWTWFAIVPSLAVPAESSLSGIYDWLPDDVIRTQELLDEIEVRELQSSFDPERPAEGFCRLRPISCASGRE